MKSAVKADESALHTFFFFAIFCVEAGAYIPLFIYLYTVVFVNVAVYFQW